jgi:hypothetical protein
MDGWFKKGIVGRRPSAKWGATKTISWSRQEQVMTASQNVCAVDDVFHHTRYEVDCEAIMLCYLTLVKHLVNDLTWRRRLNQLLAPLDIWLDISVFDELIAMMPLRVLLQGESVEPGTLCPLSLALLVQEDTTARRSVLSCSSSHSFYNCADGH